MLIFQPESPAVIRKFRASNRPDAGKMRVFYGRANDPHMQWAKGMSHGLCTQPSYKASELVNPDPKSLFKQRLIDRKESLYASHKRAPVGHSHDQTPGFPEDFDLPTKTFGIRSEKGQKQIHFSVTPLWSYY